MEVLKFQRCQLVVVRLVVVRLVVVRLVVVIIKRGQKDEVLNTPSWP
jgi:hypothetical protein